MAVKREQDVIENGVQKYELRAPDGGWGYVIVLATAIAFVCTQIPMFAFGLIFGGFLQKIGDETTGTTLSNGMFSTAMSFTGLIANGVLNRFSYRKVGVAGTIIFFVGTVGVIFSQNLYQLVAFFGVIEGVGFGLIMPAVFSAFNSYFTEKTAVMMSAIQGIMVITLLAVPQVATWSMETFGYRGTLIGLAILALVNLPGVLSLQPVKWHMKKVPVASENINDTVLAIDSEEKHRKSLPSNVLKSQIEPLLNQVSSLTVSQKSLNERRKHSRTKQSIVSLGTVFASVTTLNDLKDGTEDLKGEDVSFWKSFLQSMDMSLLKDIKYLNVSIGLALCYTSDVAFISIIPLMLGNVGFESQQIAFLITVFFGSDLVARITLTVLSSIFKFRSRILVLLSALLSAIFRVALVCNDSYVWKMCTLAALGFLRCFIQTPLPLVFSEEYSDNFSTAFSLYMAVNGVVSIIFGPLMSFIKAATNSDAMVCHSLSVAFAVCVIAWSIELIFYEKKASKELKK